MSKQNLIKNTLQELDNIAQKGAQAISVAMDKATKDNYIHFVSMFYHYSVPGEDQLLRAANACIYDDMRHFNTELAADEADHDIMAIRDLKSLGYKLSPESSYVKDYHRYWDDFTTEKTLEYLGMCVSIEHAIHYLGESANNMIQRLELKPSECEWLKVHCEEDEEHGDLAIECVKNHISPDTEELILSGARGDMDRFIKMFVYPLEEETMPTPISKTYFYAV